MGMQPLKKIMQLILTPFPSFLKVPAYRAMGADISKGASIAPFSVLVGDSISMGPNARIRPLTIIFGLREFALKAYAVISNLTIIHGNGSFTGGPRSHVGPCCLIDATAHVELGEYAALAPCVTVMTHTSHRPPTWGYPKSSMNSVHIGDLVSVGFGAKISQGVTIAPGSTIIPNSNLLGDVKTTAIIYDSPIKRIMIPAAVSQEKMDGMVRDTLIRDITEDYVSSLRNAGKHVDKVENEYIVSSKEGIQIGFGNVFQHETTAHERWLLGCNFSDDELGRDDGILRMDFCRLFYSGNPSKTLLKAAAFFQKHGGYRFADFTHHAHFNVTQPSQK